jgi:hypothetical protein
MPSRQEELQELSVKDLKEIHKTNEIKLKANTNKVHDLNQTRQRDTIFKLIRREKKIHTQHFL